MCLLSSGCQHMKCAILRFCIHLTFFLPYDTPLKPWDWGKQDSSPPLCSMCGTHMVLVVGHPCQVTRSSWPRVCAGHTAAGR